MSASGLPSPDTVATEMPSRHIELINRSYAAFRDRDLETLPGLYHPDAVITFANWEMFPEGTVYRGHEGLEGVMSLVRDVFGGFDMRVVDATDIDESRVLIEASLEVRGMASGVEVDAKLWQFAEVHDGLIHYVDTYSDEDAARRAASLGRS